MRQIRLADSKTENRPAIGSFQFSTLLISLVKNLCEKSLMKGQTALIMTIV
jgi:hypothetical protein